GGFVDFPLGWFSDDASWIAFSRHSAIRTINGGADFSRRSDVNLSGSEGEHAGEKLGGVYRYLLWWEREVPDNTLQHKLRMQDAASLPDQIRYWGGEPRFMDGLRFWASFSRFTRNWNCRLLRTLLGLRRFPKNRYALETAPSHSVPSDKI